MTIYSVEERSAADKANLYGGLDEGVEAAGLTFLDWHVRAGRVYASPAFFRLLAYDPFETGPKALVWQELLHPDDAARAELALLNCANGHAPRYKTSYRLRNIYGDYIRINDSGAIAESDAARRTLRIVSVQSLSVQSEQENHWRRTEKVHSMGLLALGLAHDLNNFLTVINGYTHILLKSDGTRDTARYLRLIQEAGELGSAVTRRMLRIASSPETPGNVDMNDVAQKVAELARGLLGRHIELALDLTAQFPNVLADVSLAEQALLNLLINARDALPNGGLIRIQTSNISAPAGLRPEVADVIPGLYLAISVVDTGTGMDPQTLKRAFNPLFTTKSDGAGTGLGLWSVQSFVDRCAGRIEIDTAVGRGTTVRMFLPVSAAAIAPTLRQMKEAG